jgi:hypothetical protein
MTMASRTIVFRTRPLHAVRVLAAIACLLAAAGPAAAQAISGAAASTSGSTANGGDADGSVRSSVVFQINNTTQLKTRYAWNISADTTVGATRDSNGTARHNLSFNVTAPGGYGSTSRSSASASCSATATPAAAAAPPTSARSRARSPAGRSARAI